MKSKNIYFILLSVIINFSSAIQTSDGHFPSFFNKVKDYTSYFLHHPETPKYVLLGLIGAGIGYCVWSNYYRNSTKQNPNTKIKDLRTLQDYLDSSISDTRIHIDNQYNEARYLLFELAVPNQFRKQTQGANSCFYQALKNGIIGARLFEPNLFKNSRTFKVLEKEEIHSSQTEESPDQATITKLLLFSDNVAKFLFSLPQYDKGNTNEGGEWRLKIKNETQKAVNYTLNTQDYETEEDMLKAYANIAGVSYIDLQKAENVDMQTATKIFQVLDPLHNVAFLLVSRTYAGNKNNTQTQEPGVMFSVVHANEPSTSSNTYAKDFDQAKNFLDQGKTLIILVCLKQAPTQDNPEPSGYIVALVANKNEKTTAQCPYKFLFLDSHDGLNHPERVDDPLIKQIIESLLDAQEDEEL